MNHRIAFVVVVLFANLLVAQNTQNQDSSPFSRLRGIDDGSSFNRPTLASPVDNAASDLQPQVQYAFTLFQFPGVDDTIAFGINDRGQIAGGYRIAPGLRHAALFDNGQLVPLAPSTALARHRSTAFDINNRGDVVGAYVDDQLVPHGFLLANNVLTNLDFPGGFSTRGLGINESGAIVGDFLDAAGNLHGFRLLNGVYSQIDFLGSVLTQTVEITNAGDIVGSFGPDLVTSHGFLLTREGQFITIDAPQGVPGGSSANGINQRGQIVGGFTDDIGNLHCYVLTAGTFTSVDLPGVPFNQCVGINSKGEIAGGAFHDDGGVTGYEATPIPPRAH